MSKTCKSLLKWLFDKLSCVKPILTNFSQFFELHKTNFSSWLWRTHFQSNLKKYLSESNGTCFIVIYKWKSFIWTQVNFFEFLTKFYRPCMDLRLSNPCSSNSTVWATMNHIRMWYQVHILPIWTLKLSESFCKL